MNHIDKLRKIPKSLHVGEQFTSKELEVTNKELLKTVEELKAAQMAIKANEARLNLALDAAKVGTWDYDLITGELVWNPYHEVLFGYEPGTPRRTLADLERRVHPEDRALLRQRAIAAIEGHGDYQLEYRVIWPDGSLRWIMSLGRALYDDLGRPFRFLGALTDVTARKSAEAEREELLARESMARAEAEQERARIHSLFMEAPALIFLQRGPEHIFELVNPLARNLLGDRELLGKPQREAMAGMVGPQDPVEIVDQVYRTGVPFFATEFPVRYDWRNSGKTEERLFNVIVQPTKDSQGSIDGTMVFGLEVTEQVQARRTLETSEERFRSLVAASTSVVWTTDAHGSFVSPQPSWQAYTGQTSEDYAGWGWELAFHPDDRERLKDIWKRSLVSREITNAEGRIWHAPSREYRYFSVRAVPIWGKDRKVREWVGTVTDVHDQKLTEKALRRSEENLRAALEDARRHAEELERSNAELEQFAYVASHDLKEPLRMVTNYVQLLNRKYKGKLDDRGDEFIRFISEGSKHMYNLIDDLLEYSRAGRQQRPYSPTSCNEVVDLVIGNFAATIDELGAEVTHDVLPMVLAESVQLTQLFQNLIGNALKYHSERRPKVHLKATSQDGYWLFSVSDNGIGIETRFFERIFVMFQRLHAREDYSGTGIGLAICKRIVLRHGGRIWVDSKVGEGSIFYFTLPKEAAVLKTSSV